MRALLHAEFDALLACAGVSQARFARLTGVTALQCVSSETLTIALEAAAFGWR
jgi:hypothetical protein